MSEMVKPIILKFDDGREYTLEFTRESAIYAEEHGFDFNDMSAHMLKSVPQLFHFAFRANHPQLSKEQTDKILLEDLGGLSEEFSARLTELYLYPYTCLVNEENTPKNSHLTVLL